ncbi:hypothetical protein SAMN05444166_8027 [Singulisphaera sp. GP187]|nr:hypothetical protein SAMN05444166_8027 [Singulisphaera sp. GP187]
MGRWLGLGLIVGRELVRPSDRMNSNSRASRVLKKAVGTTEPGPRFEVT